MPGKLLLFALFIVACPVIKAQQNGWMTGTWKSRSGAIASSGNVISTIYIKDISGADFTGTKTSEINNANITISISGAFRGRGMYLQDGAIVHKEPENAQWHDCSSCTQTNKIIVNRDSLILIDSISDCDNGCNVVTYYYRLFSEYDDDTQHYLVDRFGRPADIIGFHPYQQKKEDTLASDNNNEPLKNDVVAATTIKNAVAETIKSKEKSRRDSLDNIARIRQQQTADSALLAQQKKRQQEKTDSLNLVKQKEEQHVNDSLNNAARLEQIRLRTEDSLRNVQLKKRQQEFSDSLRLVNKKEQQRINDSLQNAITANLQKQRIADSLNDVEVRKRQQEITDSLAAARRQQYNDSLQKVLAKAVPLPIKDSNQSAAAKALTTRTNVLLGAYHISSPDILIELFDNGEIDGDRVSVYHNKEIIVSNQTLGTKPITLTIHADTINREHEFVLIAENLGTIPPNSALMRVTVGKQTYKLSVNTDMKTNARIVFYYDGN